MDASGRTAAQRPLSLLPYAPLSEVDEASVPNVIDRMKERIGNEADRSLSTKLWDATLILMGLKYSEELSERLLSGVKDMRESVTYQAILREGLEKGMKKRREEGRAEEVKTILLRQGRKRFGAPSRRVKSYLTSVMEISKLETLSDRILDVNSWQELLPEA